MSAGFRVEVLVVPVSSRRDIAGQPLREKVNSNGKSEFPAIY